ncbi:autotransporter domain-containing protein [Ancylobacter radicis]|uniref:Autotransporter domain-containing protein n=1 Tax=Ancylobacter radicis TaxID=2836179 RepID=A0ABS5R5A0_9HYPH|nr:autotransporter domain-containing protein [Ancylobacter radicis]MBS9476387.1 autotransporter domain-containing protein [Ancylobacter radicis]
MSNNERACRARAPHSAGRFVLAATVSLPALCLGAGLAPAQDLSVTGTVQIDQGAMPAYDNTSIGLGGLAGTLIVTDPGTTLSNSAAVVVGDSDAGTLDILAGAAVSGSSGTVGSGATGAATISGAGSAWNTSGDLTLAFNADGSITVEQGGLLTSDSAILGAASSSAVGAVTVTGAGSQWVNAGALAIGQLGGGQLTITDGGVVTTGDTVVAGLLAPSGTVLVSGSGSAFQVDGTLAIGTNGTVSVLDGAVMTSGQTNIGDGVSAGTGSITIDGTGSRWEASGAITVGALGDGSLVVSDGGVVTSTSALIGDANSDGQAAVLGAGSQWIITGDLTVATGGGTGTLVIADGAVVSNANAVVGDEFSPALVEVGGAGARWDSSGDVFVRTAGAVSVYDGGTATSSDLLIGYDLTTPAEVEVTGTGSSWTASDAVVVGYLGYGSLTIADGGTVRSGDAVLGSLYGTIGVVYVTGAGSSWNADGVLYVGDGGDGDLGIADGASVSADVAVVAYEAGSTGDVEIGAGASLVVANELYVGFGGRGEVLVDAGGTLVSGAATVGTGPGSQGYVSVFGAGASWTVNGELSVASEGGQGTLQVANGGYVAASFVNALGGTAEIEVTGDGSRLDAGSGLLLGGVTPTRLTLSAGGTLTADLVSVGTVDDEGNAGISAEIVIGSAAGDAATAPGMLESGAVAVQAGASAVLVLNHTASDYLFMADLSGELTVDAYAGVTELSGFNTYSGGTNIYGGTLIGSATSFGSGWIVNEGALVIDQSETGTLANGLSGSGTLVKTGSGTLVYAGDGTAFTGTTTVASGTLSLAGTLGGWVVVEDGAVLAGNGGVGALALESGATVAPGNSVGTVSVAGDFTQAAGALYAVEVSGGTADLIAVGGTATLADGALISITGLGGVTAIGTRFTVLTADGGITGSYTLVGDNSISAFYAVEASADGSGVYLDVYQDRAFTAAAVTPNQIAVAVALDGLPTGSYLHDAVGSQMTDSDARIAFNQLSGDLYPSLQNAALEDSRFVRDAVLTRLQQADQGARADGVIASTAGETGATLWGQAYGSWGTFEGTSNAAGFDRTIGGFLVGMDRPAGETFRWGGFVGFGQSSETASGASADSDDLHVGLYGSGQFGALGVRLGAAYTHQSVDTTRQVSFPGFSERLEGDYDGHTAQIFAEAGWRLTLDQTALGSAVLEPFAGLAYVDASSGSFAESGGEAALTGAGYDAGVTFTTLGLRAAIEVPFGSRLGQLTGMAGWRHAFGDTDQAMSMSLEGSAPFSITGVPVTEDALVLEGGLSVELSPAARLAVSYSGAFGGGLSDNGFNASLRLRF